MTYFMKVHILLTVHLYLNLKYLGEGTTFEEYAWDGSHFSLLPLPPLYLTISLG